MRFEGRGTEGRSSASQRFRLVLPALLTGVALVAASCADTGATTSIHSPSTTGSSASSIASSTSSTSSTSSASTPRRSGYTKPTRTTTIAKKVPASGSPAAAWSLIIEPGDGTQPIYSLMSSARHELDMTMYELADPTAVGILEADAARGVTVRVILDQAYSGASVNAAAYSALDSHGVQVHWAPDGTIFHQKTITVDDETSAIMTLNLTSEYYPDTRDFAVVTTDHSDVAAIEQTFATDWTDSGPPQPGSPAAGLVWSPGAEQSLLSLIESARRSLLVENEEMDDPDIEAALESAAARGVDVEVVMTYSQSWVDAFTALIAAGVKIHTYSSNAPLYIHAKVIVADGTTAFVGSQNFSVASLDYNRELGIVTADPALVGPISSTVAADFAGATPFASGGAPVPGGSPPPPTTTATTTTAAGAWCQATASPANDGYSGDYDVFVHSNQPDEDATASDATDTYSHYTDSSGYAVVYLWNTSPGEAIHVTVGEANCSTAA